MVLVTHNPDLAARYARRTVELLDGRLVGDGRSPLDGRQVQHGRRS